MASEPTKAVIGHHLKSMLAIDVDAVMEDYTDESVVFTPDTTLRGLGEVRSFFTEVMKSVTAESMAGFKLARQEVHGDVGYILYSVGDTVLLGTDTYVVTDGKIRVQTFATHMSS